MLPVGQAPGWIIRDGGEGTGLAEKLIISKSAIRLGSGRSPEYVFVMSFIISYLSISFLLTEDVGSKKGF